MINLVGYLPQNHRGKNVSKLMELTDAELQNASDFAISIHLQAPIDLATYGLADWEEMLSIEHNPSADLQDRREVIKAKLRSYGQATKPMIINAAEAFSGGEVDMIEYPSEFHFTIKFVGTLGIPRDMGNFIEMLNQIKPAHLGYDFEYSYRTHDMLGQYTHLKLGQYTHEDLREGVVE